MTMLNTPALAPLKPPQPLPRMDKPEIVYPDSDGEPMAENTKQWDLIVMVKENLDHLRPHDFVGGDLLWYPVKDHPEINVAPDALVAIGRPKGDRGSYKQWEEGNVAPQVVFEIWSPSNTREHKRKKLKFYDEHGVREYYAYDPDTGKLEGWRRHGLKLKPVAEMRGWVSPLLGIRFESEAGELAIYHPNGEQFVMLGELFVNIENAKAETAILKAAAQRAKAATQTAKAEAQTAKAEAQTAKAEAQTAKAEAQTAKAEAAAERQAKERLLAKLRELGLDPESL